MPAIPVDADSAVTLASAKAEARQALREAGLGHPAAAGGASSTPNALPGSPQFQQPPPPSDDVTSVDNTSDVLGVPSNQTPAAPPPPKPSVVEDNGTMGVDSAMHFLRDSFKGTGTEVANAVPRALSRLGGWLVNGAAGGVFAGEKVFGSKQHYEDAVFDWKKKYIDDAVNFWTPERQAQTGQGEGTGGGAQAIGNALEMAPGIASGGTLLLPQILQSSTDSAMSDVDQGASISKAVADGTIDGLATWLTSKFGISPSPSILHRVIKSAGAGALVQMGANVLKGGVNKAFGDPNAPAPDLFQGVDEATIIGGLFGVKGHGAPDKGQANTQRGSAQSASSSSAATSAATPAKPATAANEPTPQATSGVANPPGGATRTDGTANDAQGSPPVVAGNPPPSSVPDHPSVEPLKDIKAQFADMNSKLTPRVGVLVTPETQTHLAGLGDKTVDQAKAQGRTIDLPQGTLVLKTKGDVIKVNKRLKDGEDPQSVIGTITGAGTGKTADATAVVQGRDNTGSVATETTVNPADVPLAKQKVEDQGYNPVVTTAEEAVARRVDERNKELSGQTDQGQAPKVEYSASAGEHSNNPYPVGHEANPVIVKKSAQPVTETPGAKTEALPEPESDESPAEPTPRMGIYKSPGGPEVPVHIEDGAPEGKLRVRPIDIATGEPRERTVDVDAKHVTASESEPATHPGEQSAVAPTAVDKTTGEPKPKFPPPERRENVAKRKSVSEMTDEEKTRELLTNPVSGIPNGRAYEEAEPRAYQVHADLDSLKAANDFGGHEAGDMVIKAAAKALHEADPNNTFHVSGDEFKAQADTEEGAHALMKKVNDRLSKAEIEVTMPDGRVLKLRGLGLSYGVGKLGREAEAGLQTNKAERQARGERAPRGELPPGSTIEGNKPGRESNEGKPSSTLDQLAKALTQHEQQERKEEGYSKPAKLSERQDNASAFAAVLGKAAEESRGKLPDSVVSRAAKAAKSAVGLTLKSKNATEKGQGTSHTRVTALVDELHRAAREILGTATEADKEPALAPRAAELKRRIEQKKKPAETSAKKPAKAAKPEDVLSTAERLKTNKLAQEMIAADFDEYPKAHEKLLAHLHALADAHDDFPRDQIDQYMHFLMEQRESAQEGKTGRMSDTLESEEHEFEEPEEGFSRTYRPIIDEAPGAKLRANIARGRLSAEWAKLGENLDNNSFFEHMGNFADTGEPLGAHFLLNKFIEHTDTPILRTLLTEIRSRVPDVPVYNRSEVVNPTTGRPLKEPGTVGLANRFKDTASVQLRFDRTRNTPDFIARGLVHELIHTATMHEINANPHGELSKKIQNALSILTARLEKKYGEDVIMAHEAYFMGRGAKPANFMRKLYGITNAHELMAELANPDFIQEIAESEKYASEGENVPGSKQTLLSKIFKAIGQFFGATEPKLLQHIVDTTFDIMDAHAAKNPEMMRASSQHLAERLPAAMKAGLAMSPPEAALVAHSLRMIDEEAPPIHGVSKRIAAIDEGSGLEPTAREFVHVFKSKAIDGLRKGVDALKTVGQLYRDHMKDFGHDDSTNPLRALQEADLNKQHIISKLREITAPVAKKWMALSREDDLAVSKLMIDTTMYKLDPRESFDNQTNAGKSGRGAQGRYDEFKARFDKLSAAGREVYSDATDANRKLLRAQRRAGVDTAISALDAKLTDTQKALLYGAKTSKVYEALIGAGKLIDIGDSNGKLRDALSDFAGFTEADGPYHHLGRQGDYVVQAEPEGTREFDTRAAAEDFARMVSSLSPKSRGKVAERGGKFAVDYKAQYVSMHASRREAEREQERLDKLGLNPGNVTQKTLGNAHGALSHAMQELVTEAERKIQKDGSDTGTRALVDSLRSAFLQMTAARSAYAGSRLARKNVGGVKPGDMRRNFAEHALSAGWHTAQLQTAFARSEAMARMRGMARARDDGSSQNQTYRRGQVVDMLNKHTANEVATFGQKAPLNAMLAKLGFMSYLASPSHAAIWMTQNFTTGIPVAGARWGYGKAVSSFGRAMAAVTAPSIRAQMKAALGRSATSEEVHQVLLDAIAKHPTFGKWAAGPNSHLRQLFDRGVISHSYADELGNMAEGPSNLGRMVPGYDRTIDRVFGWARVLPAMADSINRLSTALAGLEMTGGDIRKTSDFVQEIHADYSASNKPLAFKKVSKIPGGNSITMFKTYVQEMSHLLYSNLVGTFRGENKAEAAKTLAGLVVGNALFAGVASAIGIEPLRLALYAYHKVADEEGDVWDFRNAVHHFLNDHFGKTAGNLLANGPATRLLNVDVSRRMGLSDLFFHDPPDLLTADQGAWKDFFFDQLGPMPQELAGNVTSFYGKAQRGDLAGAASSIVPIKQWQDAAKALELLQTGKRDSMGGQLTPPSTADAITQAVGFKPPSVADAQEKQGIKIEFAIKVKQTKADIVKQIVSAKNKGEEAKGWGRLDRWNRNNPTVPITNADLGRGYKAQERTTYGEPDRNEKAEAAADL